MNLRFVPVFVVLLTMLVSKSNAQLSRLAAGGGLNYTNYLGYYSAGNTGINLRVTYDVFAKGTASVGFLYGFPMKTTDFATANSTNSSNTRSTIEVPVEDVMAFKTFYGNFNYFFLKENTSPFGMYATLGAGLTIASYESTYGTYDKINYSIPGSSETSGSEMGFIIQGGAGAQAKFGPAVVFLEGQFGLPASTVNGSEVENYIPFSVCTNLGLKFHFGSDKSSKGKKKK